MTDLEQAEKKMEQARREYIKAQERDFEENVAPKIKAMLGQFLVYERNCYSCPEKESDYWDMYGRVDVVNSSRLTLTTAHVDSHGVPTLTQSSAVSFDGEYPTGWKPTTGKRFKAEVARVMKLLRINLE